MKKFMFTIEVHSDPIYKHVIIEGESINDPNLRKKLAQTIIKCQEENECFYDILHENDEDLKGNCYDSYKIKGYEIIGDTLDVPDIFLDAKKINQEIEAKIQLQRNKQNEREQRELYERLYERLKNIYECHNCPNCGGSIIGDGYTTVRHCELADNNIIMESEPDAPIILCNTMKE